MRTIIRQPTHSMSMFDGTPIVGIQVRSLKSGVYICDLLDGTGDVLIEGKQYPEGSQPFTALSDEELKSLKGKGTSPGRKIQETTDATATEPAETGEEE